MAQKILIVDDHALMRKMIMSMLGASYGFVTAGDGFEAIDQLNENPDVDIILLDINMPKMNGIEALKLLETNSTPIDVVVTDVVMPEMGGRQLVENLKKLHPAIKVIYMSGYTDDAVVRHGIISAEVDFLQKPFSEKMLLSKLQEVLRRK